MCSVGIEALPSFKEENRSLKAEADRLEGSNKSLQVVVTFVYHFYLLTCLHMCRISKERYEILEREHAVLMKTVNGLRNQLSCSTSRAESKGDTYLFTSTHILSEI